MTDKTNSSPQHHCMVVFAYYPEGETRVQRQAEALIDNGFKVDIICLQGARTRRDQKSEELVNGAQVYRLPFSRTGANAGFARQLFEYLAFFILVMFALIRLNRHRSYNVIQVHNLPDFLVFAAWIPKLFGAKLILDLHDLMPEFFAARTHRDRNSWLVKLVIWQEKFSCHFADHVITVTELWRQALIDRGIPSDKVSVVMNVADDRIFNRSSNGILAQDKETFHLLYHGAAAPYHGIDLVLKAVSNLRNEIPDLTFTIHAMNRYAKEVLAQLVQDLDIGDRVHFSIKPYPVSDLPAFILSADVGVVPYQRDIFTDGILPTKLMEYTALGVPAIAARTPAIEAYFDDKMVEFFTAGSVDELTAAIRKLYKNQVRLQDLIQQSDKFNQNYNWTKQAAEYTTLVNRLGNS